MICLILCSAETEMSVATSYLLWYLDQCSFML